MDNRVDAKPRGFFHLLHTPLQAAAIGLLFYWWRHSPPPNKAVLVLAGVASLMVLAEMRPVHKAIYFAIILSLMFLENKAIDKDRTDFAAQERRNRADDSEHFSRIGENLKSGFQKTLDQQHNGFQSMLDQNQRQFRTTMNRLIRTQRNTEPAAKIAFVGLTPQSQDPFFNRSATHNMWNIYITNTGNEEAVDVIGGSQMFIGKPDDAESARRVIAEFDKWWTNNIRARHTYGVVPPGGLPVFKSFEGYIPTPDEQVELRNHTKTIYMITRNEYSDHQGHWTTGDKCLSFQDITENLAVAHPCLIKEEERHTID